MVKVIKWIVGIFLAFWIIGVVSEFISGSNSSSDVNEQVIQENQEVAKEDQNISLVEDSKPLTNWTYQESVDEMRGETTYLAINKSLNTAELAFPYGADVELNIVLRDDAKYGEDVFFGVNKGQLFCSYQDCYISIKFDDGPVQKLATNEASGGHSESLFLAEGISAFVEKLKESETVMIEVNFYDHGTEQFKFDVSELNWSRF